MRPLRSSVFVALAALCSAAPAAAQRMKLPYSTKELEQRLAADSIDPAAHYNVALAYWNEKRYDDVERELRQAVAIDPKFAEGYLALAYLPYARRPKLWDEESADKVPDEWKQPIEESDRLYRRAFLVNPMVDLRIVGVVMPGKDSRWDLLAPGAYDFYYQMFDDVLQGRYEEAHGRFVTYLRERKIAGPGQGKLGNSFYWFQGLAAAHTQRWDEATSSFQQLFDKAKELEAKRAEDLVRVPLRTNEYRYFLATVKQAAGQADAALQLYREALEQDIGLYMAHVQMANIHEAQRRYPEAIDERRRAVDANPDDPSLLMDLGVTLGKAGQLAESEEKLRQAVEANPRDARVPFWLGLVQLQAGKKAEAKETLTRFVAMAPSRYEKQVTLAKQRLAGL